MKVKQKGRGITSSRPSAAKEYTFNKTPVNNSTTRKGRKWNRNENNTLRESIKEMTLKNIAKTHGRTRGAITSRLRKIYPTYANHGANKLNLIRANQQAKVRTAGIYRADEILREMKTNSPAYRGLSLSTLYDSDWKIPVEDQHKLIDVSIAKQKLRFHSLDRYDFTKPMDVNFIYDKQMVLLQDMDVEKVITLLNDPDVTSLLFLQPNL